MSNCQAQSTIFVRAKINKIDVKFLLDTGSSVTILHPHTWELLPLEVRQSLQPGDKSIVAVEGTTLEILGCVEVAIELGKLVRRHTIFVATITQAVRLV